MTKKMDNAWEDADRLFEQVSTSDVSAEIKTKFAELQKRADYLRSDAYHRRLHLSSTIFATVMGAIIIIGTNYSVASAGMSTPTKLHRALWEGLSLNAMFFVQRLWKIFGAATRIRAANIVHAWRDKATR